MKGERALGVRREEKARRLERGESGLHSFPLHTRSKIAGQQFAVTTVCVVYLSVKQQERERKSGALLNL